jgi:DNA-3-methyladenine glycosylase
MKIINKEFFDNDCVSLARGLLGKYIVMGGKIGRIVETEAYLKDDPASHSFCGMTKRNAPMFGAAGRAYVYFTYGMYHCFNVVVGSEGCGEAILIRAVEPVAGIESEDIRKVCNGPAKFCREFGIDREFNGVDLLNENSEIALMEDSCDEFEVVETTRIGISKGADLPYRFYIKGNEFVSRK